MLKAPSSQLGGAAPSVAQPRLCRDRTAAPGPLLFERDLPCPSRWSLTGAFPAAQGHRVLLSLRSTAYFWRSCSAKFPWVELELHMSLFSFFFFFQVWAKFLLPSNSHWLLTVAALRVSVYLGYSNTPATFLIKGVQNYYERCRFCGNRAILHF